MAGALNYLAEAPKPYYPGFRDLNLFVVLIYLIGFLYLILVVTIAYRVISTGRKLEELDQVLMRANQTGGELGEAIERARSDRTALQGEYDRLTATAPGKWFARRARSA